MIILASAKTMKESNISDSSIPIFEEKSKLIRNHFSNMDIDQLALYFKIKGKTLDSTYNYYQHSIKGKVITSLDGQVFKKITSYNKDYVANNFYVLDTMYGILNGNDQIDLFRLDFNSKAIFDISFYNYWKEEVNNFIKCSKHKQLLILSSDEYTKLLQLDKLDKQVFEITFSEEIKSTVFKKQIRGMIANYCIENQITDYNELDNVMVDNYKLTCNNTIIHIESTIK